MAATLSVIIPTYNRKHSLVRCLRALPDNVEVIVVDDGSTDGTSEFIHELNQPNLIYLWQPNAGPASARNAGISRASGDYLAFTDDDCVPKPLWPWPLVEVLQKSSDDVAGVGGKVVALRNGLISRYYAFHRILEPPESCSYIVTANCVYRAEVIHSSIGFNTQIRHAGGEDPGLSLDVRTMGYRLIYFDGAVVAHDFRQSPIDFIRTFYRYGRGCAQIGPKENSSSAAIDELKPGPVTFNEVRKEIKRNWRMYDEVDLHTIERVKFLPLVVLQRFAYSLGWRAGSKL